MHWCNRLLALLAMVSILFAFSCAGSSQAPAGNPGGDSNAMQGLQGLPAIPQDIGPAERAVSAGEGSVSVLGKDYLDQFNGSVDGNALHLDAPAGDGEGHFAYGLYKIGGLAGKQAQSLFVECAPALEDRYFVGVADYTEGSWDWFGPCTLPEFEINLSESGHRFVTELGNFYFLVLCHDGSSATHFQSTLFYAEDAGSAPGRPTELVASDGTYPASVHVEWHAGAGAAHYEVWRRTDGTEGDFALIGTTESTSYDDSAVDALVHYIYKARSVNEFGSSDFSNQDAGWASGEGGGSDWCPFGLMATDGLYADKVRLEWNAGAGDGVWFHVFRHGPNTETWDNLGEVLVNNFNDTTAEPGVTYSYKVVKSAANHDDCASNIDTGFRSMDGGCNFSCWATDGSFTDKVVVEWDSVGQGVWYDVLRRVDGGGDFAIIGDETQLNRFEDHTAEPGVVYIYKVRAYLGEAGTCDSSTDSGYAGSGGNGDGWCPLNFMATDGSYTDKVRMEWNPGNGDAYHFDVYRRLSGSETWDLLGTTAEASYNDLTASPGLTYFYKVVKSSETHAPCESNWDTGYRALPDWCPSNFVASDGLYPDKVRCEWNPGAGDGVWFHVYRRTTEPAGDWVNLGETTAASYNDTTAEPGVVYNYKVVKSANNHDDCSSNDDNGKRALD